MSVSRLFLWPFCPYGGPYLLGPDSKYQGSINLSQNIWAEEAR